MITETVPRPYCPSPVDHHHNTLSLSGSMKTKLVLCAGCDRPILDRFLLNVLDRAWHAKCVQCVDCKAQLTEKCFSRDSKLYCRDDFFRRFGTKCGGCSQGISPNDLVRRARNKVFHLKCFTCMVCRKQLSTGEELYVLDENKFICKEDYLANKMLGHEEEHEENEGELDTPMMDKLDDALSEKDLNLSMDGEDSRDSMLPAQVPLPAQNGITTPTAVPATPMSKASPKSGSQTPTPSSVEVKQEQNNNNIVNTTPSNTSSEHQDHVSNYSGSETEDTKTDKKEGEGNEKSNPPGAKRRGPRTTIKAKQLETLKAAFAATPKPTRHIREQLAQETGLNMRVIQVWFQNRRSKERRMKQLSALGARRHFFRNPRMRRSLRPGEIDDSPEMMGQPGFNYPFSENGEFYPGYPAYNDYFPGQQDPTGMNFLPPTSGPGMDGVPHPAAIGPDGQFLAHGDMLPPNGSPEPGLPPMMHAGDFPHGPPRGLPGGFNPMSQPQEMGEAW